MALLQAALVDTVSSHSGVQQASLHPHPTNQAIPSNVQTPAQPLPSSSPAQQPGSETIQPAATAQANQSTLAAQTVVEGRKSDGSPPTYAGSPKGGSPGAGDGASHSKQVKMMTGILEVLAREVLNPASTKETRDAAQACLQVWQLLGWLELI